MLKLKDLENRVYKGKICVRFEVQVPTDNEGNSLYARFERMSSDENHWNMNIVTKRTRDKDSEVYNFGYIMPKSNLPLELIAATGLRYFQLHLKEEIQDKSNLDFIIGDIVSGM